MEQYLRRNRLSGVMDGIGMGVAVYGAALMGMVWLWGMTAPALLAGLALGTIMQVLRLRWRRRSLVRREMALRRRLGAELLLEDLLLSQAAQAHLRTAQLLQMRWPVRILEAGEEGVICLQGEERLLVMCLRTPPESDLSSGDLAAAQRAARRCGADRAILCTLGRTSPRALARAEQTAIPLRVIRRDTLLALAARAAPATDEQLIALGRRRRKPAGQGGALALIFRRDKAGRYFGYGLMMTLMYVATGVRVYAVPGLVCLTMAVLCRTGKAGCEGL